MAREFSRAFYHSKAWKHTRDAYMDMMHGLCEPCLARGNYVPATIVHHKIHLSPENIDNPLITLGFDNLECVCRDCHALAHPEIYEKGEVASRVYFDSEGNVIRKNVEVD